jgi:signal transduction histidine kinase
MPMDNDSQARMLRGTIICAAGFVFALGSAMAASWITRPLWPEALLPGFFTMKFNTSLAFIGAGIGLGAALRRSRRTTRLAGGWVLLIGGATLLQYLTGLSFGLDELLMKGHADAGNPYPGRISPSSSLAFTCAGAQLLLLAGDVWRRPWLLATVEVLGFLVFALGAEGIIGYLGNVAYAYSWGSASKMAPETATGLVALGIGLTALAWHGQRTQIAHIPLWIPALLCFAVLMIDIVTPRGFATGVAYIPLVFCGLWFNRPHATFVFAALASILAMLALLAKTSGEIGLGMAVINRTIQVAAIWLVAVLVYLRQCSEIALLRYTAALERSNQELDDFAYIASHDLKEPLRGLFNNATFLREDNQRILSPESNKRLNRIGFLTQRLEALIDDLLYFSRLGRQEMAIQQTDLNVVIRDIQSLMEASLEEQRATIIIPRPLPIVLCNKNRVTEVFRNLIVNALKYNANKNKTIEVGFVHELRTRRHVEKTVFYVKDNGIGIEPEFHDAIFKIFKRLNEEDDSKRGSGVGLTFVRKIVHRHGGRIWLESTPGEGTTFYFTLAPGIAYAAA